MRVHRLCVFVALLSAAIVASVGSARDPVWSLSLDMPSERYILMEPVWVRVALTNVSKERVHREGLNGRFFLDGLEKPCRFVHDPVVLTTIPSGDPPAEKRESLVGLGFTDVAWVDLGEECNLALPEMVAPGYHTVCYRDDATVGLIARSACASFEIVAPEGIDREAYEAFGHDPLRNTERHGELLRRFPTSTYAAYVVWTRFVKGWGGMDAGLVVTTLGRPYPFRTELLPCDCDGRPVGGTETRFEPEGIFRCRAGWMELVLKHHPDIWFADEIRLRLALDRYRLGDPVACEAGLEELAENGRADVAVKARDLLSAMRAKGMLPEEGR